MINTLMTMEISLQLTTNEDINDICNIYNHYIQHSTATFHTEKVDSEQIKKIIPFYHKKYKCFTIRYKNEICGYIYLGSYKPRQAYDRTAELTIYLKPDFAGKGIGKYSLLEMEKMAPDIGIKVILGIITGENTSSIKLFERCGYEKCAHFKQVGEKFNRILDVVAYQKILQ